MNERVKSLRIGSKLCVVIEALIARRFAKDMSIAEDVAHSYLNDYMLPLNYLSRLILTVWKAGNEEGKF